MRLLIKIVAPVAAALTAATVLAFAAPGTAAAEVSPGVYPEVPTIPNACQAEHIEVDIKLRELEQALAELRRIEDLYIRGLVSFVQLREADRSWRRRGSL